MDYEQYKKIEREFSREIAAKIYAHETWARSGGNTGLRADLQEANLSRANLSGANLDYSQWPLWCGSLTAKIDKRIAAQLFYHACRAARSVDDDEVREAIRGSMKLANQFHRRECLRVEMPERVG